MNSNGEARNVSSGKNLMGEKNLNSRPKKKEGKKIPIEKGKQMILSKQALEDPRKKKN